MKAKEGIQQRIRAIAERIARDYKPERIILFGSHAWGEPGPDADVDLLIIKDTNEKPIDRIVKVRKIIQDLRQHLAMDILVVTPGELKKREDIGDYFCLKLINEGETLFAS